jgi:hypothetical protein
MLLLRAPYGEGKLFALIAPAAGRQRMENGQDKTAPAFPHNMKARATKEIEPYCNYQNAPVLGKHTQQHISGDPEKQ